MDKKTKKMVAIVGGGRNYGKTYAMYEEAKIILRKLDTDNAERIIKIIDEESNNLSRRTAFLDGTIKEIMAGADFSKCENIDDISMVTASSMISRLLG